MLGMTVRNFVDPSFLARLLPLLRLLILAMQLFGIPEIQNAYNNSNLYSSGFFSTKLSDHTVFQVACV